VKSSPPSFPPPEDAAARYDAVLRRGTSLRRRHQVAVGAGTAGVAVVLVGAVLLVSGGRTSSDQDVVTDPRPSTSTTTTTTAPTFGVTARGDAKKITVTVSDPAFPDVAGSQQCVYLRIARRGASGVAATEATSCAGAGDTPTVPLSPIEAEVGCAAATAVNGPPPAPAAPKRLVRQSTFTFTIPPGVLAPGDYEAEATGTSGYGDGCAGLQPGEDEQSEPAPPVDLHVPG
jgi:hypothetical protein